MMSYYRIHRKWMDNKVFRSEKYSKREAWVWLIENARYKEAPYDLGVKNGFIIVGRGQLSYSIRYLAEAWKWHSSSVKRFITSLINHNMIVIEPETPQMLITICNYDEYQADEKEIETGPKQVRNRSETGPKQIKEEGNKGNNVKKVISYSLEFETFWRSFPKRSGARAKQQSFSKYNSVVKSGVSHEELLRGAQRYFEFCDKTGKVGTEYTRMASTWLNNEGWLEDWKAPEANQNEQSNIFNELRRTL